MDGSRCERALVFLDGPPRQGGYAGARGPFQPREQKAPRNHRRGVSRLWSVKTKGKMLDALEQESHTKTKNKNEHEKHRQPPPRQRKKELG